jgi:hypothetical protein
VKLRHVKIPLEQIVLYLVDESGLRSRLGPDGRPLPFPDAELVPDLERAQLGCSLCGRTDTLYENVELKGWITVNGHKLIREDDTTKVMPTNPATTRSGLDREADWDAIEHVGYACNACCGDGYNLSLLALICEPKKGWDGETIKPPTPGQLKIDEEEPCQRS